MKQQYVEIRSGSYGKTALAGEIFPLAAPLARTPKGQYYITIDGTRSSVPGIEPRRCRVKVEGPQDVVITNLERFEAFNSTLAPQDAVTETPKTEAERLAVIQQRFDILDDMAGACKDGTVRALILSGPPGIGKSYGVVNQLEKQSMFDNLQGRSEWEVVKGATSALGLYKKLYRYSAPGSVVVFDDCDTVLFDDLSLNILKAALDSGKKRVIQWNTESRVLDREGIPDHFTFEGAVIFITNVKFDTVKSRKLRDHLAALMSRCHYIDLTIDSIEDKMLRIRQVIRLGMLNTYKFADVTHIEDLILDYMTRNGARLNEISLRMAIKLAELIKMRESTWQQVADVTCLKRGL